MNPTGESRNIKYYADKIHAVGGKLIVDSTFAPPPLQNPFKWGADMVMHSGKVFPNEAFPPADYMHEGTKYFAGHSDLLCGVLVVQSEQDWLTVRRHRPHLICPPNRLSYSFGMIAPIPEAHWFVVIASFSLSFLTCSAIL